jgi:phosphoribosyl 1,2-cyclic phosphodiesterase
MSAIEVRLHGVRGSIPTPTSSSEIEGKIRQALKGATPEDIQDDASIDSYVSKLSHVEKGCVGGNSTCIQITIGEHELFFDAGSGCFAMAKTLFSGPFGRGQGRADWFFTHTHHDHIVGLPMFGPIYIPGNQFNFVSPISNLYERLVRFQHFDFFPVPFDSFGSTINFVDLSEIQTYMIGEDIAVSWLANDHPGTSFSYRIDYKGKTVVFSTDAEYKDMSFKAMSPVMDFFRGADLLIFDAQYVFTDSVQMKRDWGHSSSYVGIDLALDAEVKKLLLFHHDPMKTDQVLIENLVQAQKYLRNMEPDADLEIDLSYDGQYIRLETED